MKYLYALLVTIGSFFAVSSQPSIPVNGPANPTAQCYAFTHATIYADYQTKLEDVTLVIRKQRIEAIGKGIPIPADAIELNSMGKIIYPAFIDLYTTYGIQFKPEKGKSNELGFLSAKPGAYAWNEAIRAEVNAGTLFTYDEGKSKFLSECGFGAVLSGIQDGICRGSAALVLTANGKEQELIVQEKAAAGYSFNKGTSTQHYPSSLTGIIALLRQTYYDAQWYKTQSVEKNISLEAFNQLQNLPSVFAVGNKLDIFRVNHIAREFKTNYIIKGCGNEYQRAIEIKSVTGSGLILPLNFPKPFKIENNLEANSISTSDLKHWELAPSNPMRMHQAGVEIAITASGCENPREFLTNLRKSVKEGLPATEALKALTLNPAKWLHQEHQLGTLQAGKLANFIIVSGDLFESSAIILECWSGGKRRILQEHSGIVLNGEYRTTMQGAYSGFTITGNRKKATITLMGKDTLKSTLIEDGTLYKSTLGVKKKYISLLLWLESADTVPPSTFRLAGSITDTLGITTFFTAQRIKVLNAEPLKPDTNVVETLGEVTYPFTDYGRTSLPVQESIVVRNATVWTNESDSILYNTDVWMEQGKIKQIGKGLKVKAAREIDGTGKYLTSGIIDEHSHIALTRGVNEGTQAVTSEVRMGDVINSEDINIYRQLSGGVVASQLLHGSANPIGGQSALIKLRWGMLPDEMKIEGADGFIKFALGENVKQSNWGERATTRYPQTRMGVEQTDWDAFVRAREYEKQKGKHRNLELDALVEILNKQRFITCHSYVQSEINMLMHLADSFQFRINTFTHILEGYKVADKMKKHGVGASTFADWWAYKMEVMEAIPYNAALLHKMNIVTAINSDDAEMGRRLNQEAAKSVKYGGMSEMDAWKMVTLHPAKLLHLDQRMGSIKPGKDADLVLWTDNPLSVYAKVVYTFVDGRCMFDFQQDEQMRKSIVQERQRIIQKLIALQEKGEKTEKKKSIDTEEYTCETVNDYGNE